MCSIPQLVSAPLNDGLNWGGAVGGIEEKKMYSDYLF